MAGKFGNTWWGKSWLNALDKIDYDNRLPRGRRYANNGSVKAITIKKNQITAKVQGTRPSPYKVEIGIPEFSNAETKLLVAQIRGNAQVFAALLNKELSPDIERIASQNRITLFPSKWSDFKMSCSCPDWAVPCKHIAAIIYQVGDAIDRNPWLFFQLKGLDLEKEFEGKANEKTNLQYHSPADFFMSKFPNAYHETLLPSGLRDLDLTKIPYLRTPMYKLLSEQPLFWKADFRDEWDDRVATTTKNFGKWQSQLEANPDLPIPALRKGEQVQVFLDLDLNPLVVGLTATHRDEPIAATMQELLLSLAAISRDELPDFHPSVEALWHVWTFCQALVERGAIRPMLLMVTKETFRILWVPTDSAQDIKELVQTVNAVIPPDLLFKLDPNAKKEAYLPPRPEFATTLLCSVFLGMIVAEFSVDTPAYVRVQRDVFDPPAPVRDAVIDLFFGGMTVGFPGFGGDSIPSAIHKWLGIFELGNRNLRPLLEIVESKNGDFRLQILLEDRLQTAKSPTALSEFLELAADAADHVSVLRSIHLLAAIIPPVNELLKNGGVKPVPIEPAALFDILLDKLPLLELLGVQILLPRGLRSLVRPKASVLIDRAQLSKGSDFPLLGLFHFDWQVSIGDEQLSPEAFFKMLDTTHGLVKIRNQYVLIQPDELERMRRRFERGPKPTPQQLIHAALTGEFEGTTAHLTPEVVKMIKELTEIKEMAIPKGIQATLRPYQHRGYSWMYKNARLGLGSVIADDMGLGKTLQVITLLEQLRSEGKLKHSPALAVVPTSLLANWKKEVEKFAPNLKTEIFHGSDRKFTKQGYDLMVTTYGTLRSDLKKFKEGQWGPLIIDEAQNIKNAETAQSKAIRAVPAKIHIAMSGTPVENRLLDYWSIFDFALPGYLGSQQYFKTEFSNPITRFRDPDALRLFHGVTAPFIMRRVKTDPNVISDLPDKISNNQWCSLEKEQAAIYQNVVKQSLDDIANAPTAIARKGLVLKMLTALKQVCNHPVHYIGKGEAVTENSGKSAALLPLLENILGQHEKCLIFTQYTEMGKLLVKMLKTELGVDASFLHGGLNPKQREALVTEFQEEAHRKIFILSLKAGGTGLNLTAANHVIHYDLWWNPAVENQATDRAFRIGQRKNVMVHRMICKGTLEERIDGMLNAKKDLANLTVAQGENWIGDLSNTDLQRLVMLEGKD